MIQEVSIDKFLTLSRDHFEKYRAECNLIHGLAVMYSQSKSERPKALVSVSGKEFLGGALLSPHLENLNLVLAKSVEPKLYGDFVRKSLTFEEKPNGIVFLDEAENEVQKSLVDLKLDYEPIMKQGVYLCKEVKVPHNVDCKFRKAEANDIEILAQFAKGFHLEANPHDPKYDYRKSMEWRIQQGSIYVLTSNNEVVSIAAWSRDVGSGCAVNYVYTHPKRRGKGYGSLVTAELTKHLLDGGKTYTTLFTDLENPTSNKIYQNIGYEFVTESRHYKLGSVS